MFFFKTGEAMKAVIFFLILTAVCLSAQENLWDWAVSGGDYHHDKGTAIAADDSGNSYITGNFLYTADFGSAALSSLGGNDIYVAKLDADGNWLWAVQAGGQYIGDFGYGIAADESGNCYVTGCFENSADFGQFSLTSNGGRDVFLGKLDGNGNWLWVKKAGGIGSDAGYDVTLDEAGNCYVTGTFENTASFGSFDLNSSGASDIFAAKLDVNGNWLWATSAGSNSYDNSRSIAVDAQNNSYICGQFVFTAYFGAYSIICAGGFQEDIFAAKLDADGNWLWASSAGGLYANSAYGIAADADGNSYVTGKFCSTADFGSISLTAAGSSNFASDVFAAKLDNAGNWVWAAGAGGTDNDLGYSIDVDSEGSSYLTGSFRADAYFGADTLSSAGYDDIFVAKLDEQGNWLQADRAGGDSSDEGAAISLDNSGNANLAGSFKNTAFFDDTVLVSASGYDVFVARYIFQQEQPSLAPLITAITDLPNDQGRNVQIYWDRSSLDISTSPDPILFYSIWRYDEIFDDELPEKIYYNPNELVDQVRKNSHFQYYWQRDDGVLTYITQIPALQNPSYSVAAPTLLDSSYFSQNFSKFEVIAHTSEVWTYYASEADSGYSVDNIPPDETEVEITKIENGFRLNWEEVTSGTWQGVSYEELNGIWYKIYAGTTPDFECDDEHLLHNTNSLSFDFTIQGVDQKFFRVKVTDQKPATMIERGQ